MISLSHPQPSWAHKSELADTNQGWMSSHVEPPILPCPSSPLTCQHWGLSGMFRKKNGPLSQLVRGRQTPSLLPTQVLPCLKAPAVLGKATALTVLVTSRNMTRFCTVLPRPCPKLVSGDQNIFSLNLNFSAKFHPQTLKDTLRIRYGNPCKNRISTLKPCSDFSLMMRCKDSRVQNKPVGRRMQRTPWTVQSSPAAEATREGVGAGARLTRERSLRSL